MYPHHEMHFKANTILFSKTTAALYAVVIFGWWWFVYVVELVIAVCNFLQRWVTHPCTYDYFVMCHHPQTQQFRIATLLDMARAVHRASYHVQFALMNAPVSTSY